MDAINTDHLSGGAPMNPPSDEQLRALLLHRLPDDEAAALEQRLVVEEGVAERVRQLEYALLDAHARGKLAPEDRVAVQRYLLRTAADRQRLRVARALARISPPRTAQANRVRRMLAWLSGSTGNPVAIGGLLAGLAVIIVSAILLGRPGGIRQSLPGHSDLPAPAVAGSVFTISLLGGVSRGEQVQPVAIPAGTVQVRLQAEVEDPDAAAAYELQVLDPDGKPLQTVGDLHLRRAGTHAYVEALVPATSLAPGLRRINVRAAAGALPPSSWTIQVTNGG